MPAGKRSPTCATARLRRSGYDSARELERYSWKKAKEAKRQKGKEAERQRGNKAESHGAGRQKARRQKGRGGRKAQGRQEGKKARRQEREARARMRRYLSEQRTDARMQEGSRPEAHPRSSNRPSQVVKSSDSKSLNRPPKIVKSFSEVLNRQSSNR